MDITNNNIFLACGGDGIRILELSDLSSPREVVTYNLPANSSNDRGVFGVYASEKTAWLLDAPITVNGYIGFYTISPLDISDLKNIVQLSGPIKLPVKPILGCDNAVKAENYIYCTAFDGRFYTVYLGRP
jgi:hypothetical protein